MPVRPPGHALRALTGVGLLAVVIVGLHLLGHPALAPPELTAPATWADWATSRSPIMAAMALVRLLAIGLSWYLLAVAILQVLASTTESPVLASGVRVVTTATSRQFATAVLGAGVLATTPVLSTPGRVPTAVAVAAPAAAGPPTMGSFVVPGPPAPAWDRPTLGRGQATDHDEEAAVPRLTRVDSPRLERVEADPDRPGDDDLPDDPTSTGSDVDPDASPGEQVDRARADGDTWTVRAGDHFWAVAEREVTRRLQRTPSEDEVAGWWRELVDVNTDRLVDADNPDLILPGQVMRFPDAPVGEAR